MSKNRFFNGLVLGCFLTVGIRCEGEDGVDTRVTEDTLPKSHINPMTSDDIRSQKLTVLQDDALKDMVPEKTFDARKKWPLCRSIRHIGNQGPCGTCWALVAAAVLSDRLCIAMGGNVTAYFSAMQAAGCTFPDRVNKMENCKDGSDPAFAFVLARDNGIATGGLYGSDVGCVPYDVSMLTGLMGKPIGCETSCKNKKQSFNMSSETLAAYDVEVNIVPLARKSQAEIDNKVNFIKRQIQTHGPVAAGIMATGKFRLWGFGLGERGTYTTTDTGSPGDEHAVRIIGWREDAWLVANSWGTWWGDKGLFWIKMGNNTLKIEEDISMPVIYPRTPENKCKTADFCSGVIDQAIPIDPKDLNAGFYLFRGECVQKTAMVGGKFVTIGIAMPTEWILENAPVGSITKHKFVEEESRRVAIPYLYNANAQVADCIRKAVNKYKCWKLSGKDLKTDVAPASATTFYYDKDGNLQSWTFSDINDPRKANDPRKFLRSMDAKTQLPIRDFFINTKITTVNTLMHLDAGEIAVFGVNAAKQPVSAVILYPSALPAIQEFTAWMNPVGGSVLTCY